MILKPMTFDLISETMADRNDLPFMLARIKLRFQTSIVITYKRANMWTDGYPMHHDGFQVDLSVVGQVKVIDVWWLRVTFKLYDFKGFF